MPRYIDADEFIKKINGRTVEAHKWSIDAINCNDEEIKLRAEQAIATFCEASWTAKKMPTADVVSVVRGRWMETDAVPHRVYCSECYATFIPNREWIAWKENMIPKNFCPNCGADMRGDKNE